MAIFKENTDMATEVSNKSSETQSTTSEEPIPGQLPTSTVEEKRDSESDDDPGYDEPRCHWTPSRHLDEDCGEGVICPPCG